MKKAALFLMMSSTAFAAPQKVAPQVTRVQPPQAVVSAPQAARAPQAPHAKKHATHGPRLARTIVPGKKPQALPLQYAPQTAPQKAPQQVVQQPSPQRSRITKRPEPTQALQTNAPGIQAPKFGDFELKAQLRNTMTMARAEELQNIDGENFGLGTEVRIGLKHVSGWGFNLTGSHQTNNFADSAKNTGTNGDVSLMVMAPSFYKNDFVDVHGLGRFYLPTSEKSKSNSVRSAAYWNYVDFTFGHRFTATNLTIARFYDRDTKADGDLSTLIYNAFEVYHQTTPAIALALGGQYTAEDTYRSATGTQVDIYPFVDFTFIPNLLIEAKYYFPVLTGGNGSVGATGAALNQSQAELFIKLAI